MGSLIWPDKVYQHLLALDHETREEQIRVLTNAAELFAHINDTHNSNPRWSVTSAVDAVKKHVQKFSRED